MVQCTQYYYAEDQNGNDMPGTVYADFQTWNGSFWESIGTLEIPSGLPDTNSLQQGDRFRIGPMPVSGYNTPSEIEFTACTTDITLIYKKPQPEGDIVSGDVQPASQVAGESCDFAVTVKNKGTVSGSFTLYYYEGALYLGSQGTGTIQPGVTVPNYCKMLTMPERDFTITVKLFNNTTEEIDDTYNITCYLIGGTEYYVKTGGDDDLSGSSWANAWATIDKASRTVPDGSTLHIGFGTYDNEPAGNLVAPQNVGSEGIAYKPETEGSEGGTGTVIIEKNA